MTVRVAIYFLGRNRPAYFEGDHLHDVLEVVIEAAAGCDRDTRNKLYGWIIAAEESVGPDRPAVSIEHGAFGLVIDINAQPLGAVLEISASLHDFPGLDYTHALTPACYAEDRVLTGPGANFRFTPAAIARSGGPIVEVR